MSATPHSAEFDLGLHVGANRCSRSHVGSAWVIVKGPVEHVPSGPARLVVSVDGHEKVREVFLPDGIPAKERPLWAYHANVSNRANGNGRGI